MNSWYQFVMRCFQDVEFSRIVIYWPELTWQKTVGSAGLSDFQLIMQNVIGLILFFLAGRLFCAANLILPLVSRWEVTKLTSFLQNFLGFCCFECRIWSLVRCSLSTFFGLRGWKTTTFKWWICPRRIRFTLSECGTNRGKNPGPRNMTTKKIGNDFIFHHENSDKHWQ